MAMNDDQMQKSIDLAAEGFVAVKNRMLQSDTEDISILVRALDLLFAAAIIRKDIGFFQTVKKEIDDVIQYFSNNGDKKTVVGRLEVIREISYLLAGSIPDRKNVDFVKSGKLRGDVTSILHRGESLYMSELRKKLTKKMGYDVSSSSLSQIIKKMTNNGIVHTDEVGNKKFCRLTVEGELVAQELSEPLLHVDKFGEILQSIAHHLDADVLDLSIKLGVPDEIVQRVKDVYAPNIIPIDYQGLEKNITDIQTNINDMRIRMGRLECEIPRSALEIKKRHEDIQELVAHTFDDFPTMKRVDKAHWNDSENLHLEVPTLGKGRSEIMRQNYQSSEGVPHKAPTAHIQGKSKYEDYNISYA